MKLPTRTWAHRTQRPWALTAVFAAAFVPYLQGQVFVVGERTATSELKTDFTPTNLQLPEARLTERGRRELIRNLEAEQGFAHRALPMGPGLTLRANGDLSPGAEAYKRMVYEKGQAAAPGDRVAITAMEIKSDRIIFDLNGGPYAKHRWLSHIQFNDNNVVAAQDKATGARIVLLFKGSVPEISAPEVKALLEPLLDFGVKSSEQAYADTLPTPLKNAIASHDVLVGMTHRMVLAALGAPESKLREQPSGDVNGARYEEWIYGHVPQTVRFVRFVGDRVSMIEIAALGKPMEIHDKDEMAGYIAPVLEREIALGDRKPDPDSSSAAAAAPPTLRKPGEPIALPNKVQFPDDPKTSAPPTDASKPVAGTAPATSQLL
ncbi:hypothetical protein BH10ACI4_BH10ACI4_16530 [soil metagenome]